LTIEGAGLDNLTGENRDPVRTDPEPLRGRAVVPGSGAIPRFPSTEETMTRTTTWMAALGVCLVLSMPAAAQPDRPPRDPLMTALDLNGDGVLSADEIEKAAASLKKLDRSGDGRVTRDEIGRPRRERRFPPGRSRATSGLTGETIPRDAGEKKIVGVLDDLDSERRGNMNVPRIDGRLLRLLTESLGAKRVVEIGTSNGYSGLWFCLALRSTGGRLITHEIDPRRARMARDNFERAGVGDLVRLVEGDAHEEVVKLKGPIDLVFIDADKSGYADYLRKVLPLVRPGGLILGHNMVRPTPDPDFVKAITTDPSLETIFLNMHEAGISVSVKKRAVQQL